MHRLTALLPFVAGCSFWLTEVNPADRRVPPACSHSFAAPLVDLTMATGMTALSLAAITGIGAEPCRDGPCGIEKVVVPGVFAIPIVVYTIAAVRGLGKVSRCNNARRDSLNQRR